MDNNTKTNKQLLWEKSVAIFFRANILPKISEALGRESLRLRGDIDAFKESLYRFIQWHIDEIVLFAGTSGFHRLPRHLQTYCFMNMVYEMNRALPNDYPIRFVRILIRSETNLWTLGTIETQTPQTRDLFKGKLLVHTHIFKNMADFKKQKRSEITISRITLAYPPRDYMIP